MNRIKHIHRYHIVYQSIYNYIQYVLDYLC